MQSPLVALIMGSQSDLRVMSEAAEILEAFNIPFDIKIVSAHRTPLGMVDFAMDAQNKGYRVIIAGAGGAAHLPGMVASITSLPVIGVPVKSTTSIDGWDSILSILQMPPGVPVATVGMDNARNAGILAAQILGTSDAVIMAKVVKYKEELAAKVKESNDDLAERGYKRFFQKD